MIYILKECMIAIGNNVIHLLVVSLVWCVKTIENITLVAMKLGTVITDNNTQSLLQSMKLVTVNYRQNKNVPFSQQRQKRDMLRNKRLLSSALDN